MVICVFMLLHIRTFAYIIISAMQDTQDTTVTELARVQLRIPSPTWDRLKIQAIREKVTAEQLAARAFDAYLSSVEAA